MSTAAVALPSSVGSPDPVVEARLVGRGVGWVLTQHSLKRTTDDGRTWMNVTPAGLTIHPIGDPQQGQMNVYGLGGLDPRHAFLATESLNNVDFTMTIWRTADGGATWRRSILRHLVHETGDICGTVCGSDGFGVSFNMITPADAFLNYGYPQGVDEEVNPIYQTSDGGASWHRVGTGGSPYYFQLFFRTPTALVMSNGYALNSTTTGWGNWATAELDTPSKPFFVSAVSFWNARSWSVAIGQQIDYEFAVTTDAGHTWLYRHRALPKPDPGEVADGGEIVAFLDPVTWLATAATCSAARACATWLVRTGDRGHSWRRLGRVPDTALLDSGRPVFADPNYGWVGLYGGPLVATEDGGRTWRQLEP